MDAHVLNRFVADSRRCSSTEKCAVACAIDDLSRAPWLDSLADAWRCLDQGQKSAVNAVRIEAGKPAFTD